MSELNFKNDLPLARKFEPRIEVFSRQEVEGGKLEPVTFPFALISIHDPDDPVDLSRVGGCMFDILELCFSDIDTVSGFEQYTLFNKEHAKQIVEFVKMYVKHTHFFVHCDAGISRSPAVAAAISKGLGRSDMDFFKKYVPNRRVYSMLLNEIVEAGGF